MERIVTEDQHDALRGMARWDTQHTTSTGEMPRLWYGGVVAAAVAHIDAQAAELVSLRSTCAALHHAVCIRRDEYDAQAARIRRLEGMVAIWIGFAYERSKVDYATFAAGLTPEELAAWRIDPEVAMVLDEHGNWREGEAHD
jgi:hypothetical protein